MASPYLFILAPAKLLFLTALLSQQVGFLDLTQLKDRIPEPMGRWASGAVISAEGLTVKKTAALEITLSPFEGHRYAPGERFAYEVRLENVTEQPFFVPWEPDWRKIYSVRVKRPPPGFIQADLSFGAVDPDSGEESTMATSSLFGSSLVSGSVKELRPGDSVRIRAPASWRLPAPRKRKLPIAIKVFARFQYFYGIHSEYYKDEYLSARAIVQFRRR